MISYLATPNTIMRIGDVSACMTLRRAHFAANARDIKMRSLRPAALGIGGACTFEETLLHLAHRPGDMIPAPASVNALPLNHVIHLVYRYRQASQWALKIYIMTWRPLLIFTFRFRSFAFTFTNITARRRDFDTTSSITDFSFFFIFLHIYDIGMAA